MKVDFSGVFPWGEFKIHLDDKYIHIGHIKNKTLPEGCFSIGFHSLCPDYDLYNQTYEKNNICLNGEYNSYLTYREKNTIYVSTHCFHGGGYDNFFYKPNDLIYDGIIVAVQHTRKRRHLMTKLNKYNGFVSFGSDIDSNGLKHNPHNIDFKVTGNVRQTELNNYYNMSKVSFCLSDVEGECRSSMESLLAGCPVITTKPVPNYLNPLPVSGGRVEAFGPENSIFCEPTEDGVLEAYEWYLSHINDYDREYISKLAKSFLFNSKIQLIKVLHHVVVKEFNGNCKDILTCLLNAKISCLNDLEYPIRYYISNYL